MRRPLHLSVALDGTGHRAAARAVDAGPAAPFPGARWAALAVLAEQGALDFVTVGDSSEPPTDGRAGRLDAVAALARVAPLTRRIGLVPTVTATRTEPFPTSTALAGLDLVSEGRAGWLVDVPTAGAGGRPPAPAGELWAEAAEAVEAVARLWDGSEHAPATRDTVTDRSTASSADRSTAPPADRPAAPTADSSTARSTAPPADRSTAPPADRPAAPSTDRSTTPSTDRSAARSTARDGPPPGDIDGPRSSVRGPSTVPRPPQGRPPVVVALDVHDADGQWELAARHADVVLLDADGPAAARLARAALLRRAAEAGRGPDALRVLVRVAVGLGGTGTCALPPAEARFTGAAAELAALLADWHAAGGVDGFHLLPASAGADLPAVVHELVPWLRERGLFRAGYDGRTLRDHLGLPRPAGRPARETETAPWHPAHRPRRRPRRPGPPRPPDRPGPADRSHPTS
ncbi:FMNH2-dependent monooxygenase [Streptomyces sp. NPDC003247]|uniref:FMNH2-dependent monooxygenase n=1 Tax=Streptomyces sp. NPDC003247 TaxID=3364677 RepID=UPI003697AD46